ncbi:MAG: FAD-binding protein [Rhodobacteraceae bacterium]|nr:FAD-binding protein [Paracoccaceae bacterium]
MIETEADLSEVIAGASGPLTVVGGGTRLIGLTAGQVLATEGLSGVRLYEPGALTLVAGAGTPLGEIEALLATEGQALAFEPMDHRGLLGQTGAPSVGGMVAANVSGPRRVKAGACRDFLLGVRFVDGSGRILKNGGRVMKNVTGYDLAKLMAGSFGTLGVLSEVSLKVLPRAETSTSVLIEGLGAADAVRAMGMALGSPFDISAAAHAPIGPEGAATTMLRLEGFQQSVAYRAGRLRDHLREFGSIEIEVSHEKSTDIWRWVRDVQAFHASKGDVWRIVVKPTDGPEVGKRLVERFAAGLVFDQGGGLIWVLVPAGSDARAVLSGIEGHARIERASNETKAKLGVFPRQNALVERLSAGLRAKFDPRGILNPGLMDAL